jgi:Asp-tRNA(Asn)/Glu-tRNA(Gln) amidotransferase A subunit family amidase
LKEYGMINAGKANMHEFAFGTTSKNKHYGPAKSAFDKERTAGGSSGGSGGCVGTGTVPIALGTDTGGSIRIPATSNGVIGYKPTINRWPCDYGIKMSHFRDTVGPLGVSMDDIVLLDYIVSN